MSVDISKIKPGDKVTLVPLEVASIDTSYANPVARIRMPSGNIYVAHSDQIAAHHPAPRELKVGDRVRWDGSCGTIEHVARGKARVLFDNGSDDLFYITSLTLVEDGE